jgi:hypothetical protein
MILMYTLVFFISTLTELFQPIASVVLENLSAECYIWLGISIAVAIAQGCVVCFYNVIEG